MVRRVVAITALAFASAACGASSTNTADAALATSVVALAMTGAQTILLWQQGRTQEEQRYASVWPSVRFVSGNTADDGTSAVTFTLSNAGVGPALLKALEIEYEGVPTREIYDLLERACPQLVRASVSVSSAAVTNVILKQDSVFVTVPKGNMSDADFACVDRLRWQIDVHACYCSVMDECWAMTRHGSRSGRLMEVRTDEPVRVRSCKEAQSRPQFGYGE